MSYICIACRERLPSMTAWHDCKGIREIAKQLAPPPREASETGTLKSLSDICGKPLDATGDPDSKVMDAVSKDWVKLPTPRTDAAAYPHHEDTMMAGWEEVDADFARTLERELAAVTQELSATKARLADAKPSVERRLHDAAKRAQHERDEALEENARLKAQLKEANQLLAPLVNRQGAEYAPEGLIDRLRWMTASLSSLMQEPGCNRYYHTPVSAWEQMVSDLAAERAKSEELEALVAELQAAAERRAE